MQPEMVLRWTARIWGVASTLLLMAFAFGGRENLHFTAATAFAFALFPCGVVAGFVIAWWRELVGGLITVSSLILFYLVLFSWSGRVPLGPYFLLFAAPGFIHMVSALMARRRALSAMTGRTPPLGSPA